MTDQPDIVLVMTDSSRRDTLGCYGGPGHSPHLDRLASEGVRFTQAHCQAPVCMPARASLLTGTHTPVHGCVENGVGRRTELVTLPDLLGERGYHTIMVGKTHFAGPVPESFAVVHELAGEKNADVDDEYARHLADHGFSRASRHPNPVPPELFCDAFLVDQTIDAIDQAPTDQPVFAFCSLPSPHSPLDPPGAWADAFTERDLPPLNWRPGEEVGWTQHLRSLIGQRGVEAGDAEQPDGSLDADEIDRQRRRYYGLAAYTDAQIGRLLDHLGRRDRADNTLIIFTTDHGQQYYDHGFNDKHTFFDESWRIPMIMTWPGRISPGTTAGWAMTTDVTATVAAATGADALTLQGFDLLARPDEVGSERQCASAVLHRSLALASADWKIEYVPSDGQGRLFDRRRDPDEQRDLWSSGDHREVRDRLLQLLLGWRADLVDVQHLREHTHPAGPVGTRVAAMTASLRGVDAERRLSARVSSLTETSAQLPHDPSVLTNTGS